MSSLFIWLNVYLGGFQDDIGLNLTRSQCCCRVCGKVRVTGASGENDHSSKFQMANGAAEDEWLGHIFHFYRCLNTGCHTDLLECAPQRESIDDCGKHTHVIRRGPIHATIRGRQAAPDVAAANYHCHLHAEI